MPSFVEGFGLPLIEALQLKAPVIASDLAVFRELAGNIPTYVDPDDRRAWVEAVLNYATADAERNSKLKDIAGFRAPTWQSHFSKVEKFLDKL